MRAKDIARMAAGVIAAFIVYALIVGLEGTGRHFLEIAVVRFALLGVIVAFSRLSGASALKLGRAGLGIVGVATVAFLAGAVGAIAADGWSYDVFASSSASPPWYAYVIGLAGILTVFGTVLTGIAGRRSGRLAFGVIAAGASFPIAFVLGPTAGHVTWLSVWLIVAIGLARVGAPGRSVASATVA